MKSRDSLQLAQTPIMKTQMLIRKPVHEVFEAFIDPVITAQFWFTKGSGKLKPGAKVTWEWEMYNVSTVVQVKAVEKNKRIVIEWNEGPTTVEWHFFPQADNTTFVTITESGFGGSGDQMVARAIDSMGGFSFLLAAAKAFLEHGIALNITADHSPAGLET
jgi:uncharacterized protein YndB with AHSA1/START domain